MTPRLFLSPTEYAEQVGVSVNLIYRMLRAGQIPHIRLNKIIRIPKDAVPVEAGDVEETMAVTMYRHQLKALPGTDDPSWNSES